MPLNLNKGSLYVCTRILLRQCSISMSRYDLPMYDRILAYSEPRGLVHESYFGDQSKTHYLCDSLHFSVSRYPRQLTLTYVDSPHLSYSRYRIVTLPEVALIIRMIDIIAPWMILLT